MPMSQSFTARSDTARELPDPEKGRVSLVASRQSRKSRRRSMKKMEWFREALSGFPSAEQLAQREAAGWRMAAIEWEREVPAEIPGAPQLAPGEEIPYGT